jgi:hypothetical protein
MLLNVLAPFKRTHYIIPLFLMFNFIFVGVIASYLEVSQVYWLGAIIPMSLMLLPIKSSILSDNRQLILFAWLAYLAINWLFITGNSLKAIALKDYVIPSIAMLFASRVILSQIQLAALYRLIRLIVLIQLPFVISQFFITALASSSRSFDWDLISGTFGFNPQGGGGNSAGLLLFLCFYCTIAIKKIRLKQATQLDVLAILFSIASVLMMETKIVIVLVIFIVISILEKRELLKPKVIISSLLFISVFIGVLITNYNSNFSTGSREGRSVAEYITDISDSYSAEDLIDYSSGEVSRQAAIDIWLSNNVEKGVNVKTLLGHGLTSSKFANANNSEAVVFASPINFAASQFTLYLWDVGIIGVLMLAVFLLYLLISQLRLKTIGLYESAFKSGGFFLILACILYPFYTTAMHTNSVTFSIFILLLLCTGSKQNEENSG